MRGDKAQYSITSCRQWFCTKPCLLRSGLLAGLLFIFATISANAQQVQNVTVFVTDSISKQPVNATIGFAASNETFKTSENGKVVLALKPGNYVMIISSVGYKQKKIAVNIIGYTPSSFFVNMVINSVYLKNVTVTAANKPIEAKDGKLIYNIEKSITAQGTTAFDQVRKTPGITVDAEENLALKGSSAVTIMIDGKQTYLGGQQLSTYLKSLPAESLARIEVMATPSSQYDAAGNAGIINIIIKKSNQKGYALNLRGGVGTGKYMQSADGLVGNIRTKSVNVFGSYDYNYNHSNVVRTSYRTISTNGTVVSYDRHSVDPAIANNNSYKAGADFYLGKKTTLGFVYNGTHNHWHRDGGGPTYLRNADGNIDSIARNKNITDEPATSNAYNIDFVTKLDTAGGQLSADGDYASYNNTSNGVLSNGMYSVSGTALQPYQSLAFQQPSHITIRSIKSDLVLPHGGSIWKAGVKYAYVRTDNDFSYDSLINGSYVHSKFLSNHFIYDEKVAAAYLSFSSSLDRTVLLDAGARVEHTNSTGSIINTNIITNRDYTNLFPYLSITKTLPGENSFNVSITRRINRPAYANLNPTRYFFDKYSYYEGNPFLQPELSWNLGLMYTLKQDFVATFTYSHTTDAILDFSVQDSTNGTLKVSNRNFSHKDVADLLLVLPFKPARFWSVQTTLDFIYASYLLDNGGVTFQPQKLYIDAQLAQTFTLPKKFTAELTAFYTSPSLGGIYMLRTYFQADAGIRKSFLNNRLNAVLSCRDIFRTDRYWAYSIYGPTNIRYDHRPDSRRINLALTYRIGGKLSAGKDRNLDEQNRL